MEFGGGAEQRLARHGRADRLCLQFLDVDAALGERAGNVADDSGMVGAEQFEAQTRGRWRGGCRTAFDDDRQAPVLKRRQGGAEVLGPVIGDGNSQDTCEAAGEVRHAALEPVAAMAGDRIRQRFDQPGPILANHRQYQERVHALPFFARQGYGRKGSRRSRCSGCAAADRVGCQRDVMGLAESVGIEDVRAAARLLDGQIVRTPCTASPSLSRLTGAEVVLKLDNLQFTGSFKDRGALVKLSTLGADERRRGVIAMSAGNHAQSVAHHAARLGIPATIVMPRFTPTVKVERTRGFGAEVILHGEGLEQARAHTDDLVRERGLVLIHPYDDPAVIAGQGTVALEVLEQCPGLDALLVPVGGGGLISGIAVAAKALAPGIEVIGVEAARFPAMRQALAGEPIVCGNSTIAEGIAVKEPGRRTLEIVRALVDDIVLVDEDAIEAAVLLLLDIEKTVVEGAGAVGLAALLAQKPRFAGRRVGVIVSGGNIDLMVLSSIIQRGLVRRGRLVRLNVGMPDRPGSLARASAIIAEANANVIEVQHQRAFSVLSIKQVLCEFVIETLGRDHLTEIVAALERDGFPTELPDAELLKTTS